MDHVSGPLIFNQWQCVRANWLWHNTTTFQPYALEMTHVDAVVKGKSDLSTSGLSFVLQSLTPNHRGILKVLAEYQLGQWQAAASSTVAGAAVASGSGDAYDEDGDGEGGGGGAGSTTATVIGVEFAKLLELCVDKLLVATDSALRTHLVELKDHKLVATRRGTDRRELLYIPLSKSQVRLMSELEAV